ncbi:MAG TPA: toll/interleukin-1 receptor domain-containing protein [Longimicrobium sp.]|jgi:hypothetical protein
MAEHFEYDVFIAYAHPDSNYAERVYDVLAAIGVRVFLDTRELEAGVKWPDKIAEAQKKSVVTVVLISKHSDSAYFQKEEIQNAIQLTRNQEHRVIPVYLTGSTPTEVVPLPLMQVQSIFVSREPSLLTVAQKIETALKLSKQRQDWEADIDPATVVIVTGCHHKPELFDRPLAYQLKDALDRRGRDVPRAFLRSVVMGDIWFTQHSGFTDHPNLVSIGSPGVNPLTQQIIEQSGPVRTGDKWWVMRGGNRWALYGERAEDTQAAVLAFQEHDLVPFLGQIWFDGK